MAREELERRWKRQQGVVKLGQEVVHERVIVTEVVVETDELKEKSKPICGYSSE